MLKIKWITLMVGIVVLSACQHETLIERQGGFQLSLAEITTSVETKAVPNDLKDKIDLEQFTLKITPKDEESDFSYDGSFQEYVVAPVGIYDIEVTSGENPVLAIDYPYYVGRAEGTISANHSTPVTIECGVANALSTFIIPPTERAKLEELFTSYTIQATVGSSTVSLDDWGNSFYYQAGSMPTFTFVGTFKTGNDFLQELESSDLAVSDVFAAGKHCVITITVSDPKVGEANLNIDIKKVEVSETTLTETIPLEWLPAPQITSIPSTTGFVETVTPTGITFEIEAASDVQDICFRDSYYGDETYYWSENRDVLEEIGISFDSKTGIVSINDYIGNLQSREDSLNFEIDVKANNRWCSTKDTERGENFAKIYTYKINPPEFSVSVQDYNCWSRQFTIDEIKVAKGNKEKIQESLIYQYYDGSAWQTCTTRDGVIGRTQAFSASAENITSKTYRVRALYRGTIVSLEATATLETPVQLTNGNLDTWSKDNFKTYGLDNIYRYYVGESSSNKKWGTRNILTMSGVEGGTSSGTSNQRTAYRWNSCTIQTSDAVSGSAAEIRTMALATRALGGTDVGSGLFWGNKDVSDAVKKQYRVYSGYLYTGTTDVTPSAEIPNEKELEHKVRPTSFSFRYKFSPYNNNPCKVYAKIYGTSGNLIATSDTFTSTAAVGEYTLKKIDFDYSNNSECAKYIFIMFQSGTNEGTSAWNYVQFVDGSYDANPWSLDTFVGNILRVDNIQLIYDK